MKDIASPKSVPPPCITEVWESLGRVDRLMLSLEGMQLRIKELSSSTAPDDQMDVCVAERNQVRVQMVDLASTTANHITTQRPVIEEYREHVCAAIVALTRQLEPYDDATSAVETTTAEPAVDVAASDQNASQRSSAANTASGTGAPGEASPTRTQSTSIHRTVSVAMSIASPTEQFASIYDTAVEALAITSTWHNGLNATYAELRTKLQYHVNAFFLREDSTEAPPPVEYVHSMATFMALHLQQIVLILNSIDTELSPWRGTFPTDTVCSTLRE